MVTEGKFQTISGCIHYLHRPGTTPYFVFLSGLGGDSTAWKATFDLLPQQYSLLAIDVPGSGFSYRPTRLGDYSTSKMAQVIHPLITSLIHQPYVVVGHCYGGFVARQLAFLYPQEVHSLFTFSTAVFFPPIYSLFLLNPIGLAVLLFFRLPFFSYIPRRQRTFCFNPHTRDIDLPRLVIDFLHTSPYSYLPSLLSVFLFHPQPLNHSVRNFCFFGSQDIIIPPHQPALMTKFHPHCQVSTYQGGHVVPLSDPQYIAQALIDNTQF